MQLIPQMSRKHADARDALSPQNAQLSKNNWDATNWKQRFRNTIRCHSDSPRSQSSGDNGAVHISNRSETVGEDAIDGAADSIGRVVLRPPT